MNRRQINVAIKADLKRYYPAVKRGTVSILKPFITNRGFRAIYSFRMRSYHKTNSHILRLNLWLLFDYIFNKQVEIGSGAIIGPGLLIVHPLGVIIADAQIGAHCTIWQNVTIGANFRKDETGRSIYPFLGNNVKVLTGAVIVGPVNVGSNVVVGANSVVIKNVPSNSVVGGVPAKIINSYNKDRFGDYDHMSL